MCEKVNNCHLLYDPKTYNPDTLDLSKDKDAGGYWFNCFRELVGRFAIQAAQSQRDDSTAEERANNFKNDYLKRLDILENADDNFRHNESITVRTLLELNEVCLRLHGFDDAWREQKTIENQVAITSFKSRLEELDCLKEEEKWIELVRGLLAGNMFDWGAQAISEILENDKNFGIHEAVAKMQSRPWLIDDLDVWLERLKGPSHKCAAIFVDNSGVDIILGVLPFVRELLTRKTKVILCANTEPSLNDVTYKELEGILEKCCCECDILRNAKLNAEIFVYGNGQSGPCLDFRRLNEDLFTAIVSNETDLLVIEGMGRTLHTNLYAKFRCETLKLAVVKNKWLANLLGGDTFSVICKYEKI